MIKTVYFLIKTITTKQILSILIFSQLHYVGTCVVMTVWAFGGHCSQLHDPSHQLISNIIHAINCYLDLKITT